MQLIVSVVARCVSIVFLRLVASPPFSIANGNAFGKAPDSIENLNMVELSMGDYEFPEPLVMDASEEEEGSDDPKENISSKQLFSFWMSAKYVHLLAVILLEIASL
eukprot:scaffold33355_cov36-Attheya_sp.AAC.4